MRLAKLKRAVIFREKVVGGQASMTTSEERVLLSVCNVINIIYATQTVVQAKQL